MIFLYSHHCYSLRLCIPEMSLIVSSSSSSSVTSFISSKTWKSSRISLFPLTYYFSVSGRLCFGQNKQSSCYEWGTSLLLAGYYPHFELVGWGVCQAIICSFVQISDIRRGVARITRGEDLLTICKSSPEAYKYVLLILNNKLKKLDFILGWKPLQQLLMGMLYLTIPGQGWHFPCVLHHIVPSLWGISAARTILLEDSVSEMSEPRASVSEWCYNVTLRLFGPRYSITSVPTPTPPVGQSAGKLQSVLQWIFVKTKNSLDH